MKFAIITHVNHIRNDNQYFAYAPYVLEMNVWLKYVDEVIIVAPLFKKDLTAIDISYQHQKIDFRSVPDFSFTSVKNNLKSVFKLPIILCRIFWAMKKADHIHLRCPGNMGLLGCFVQILFPNKKKTTKYAGNWDPESKQPWTYRLQKYILNNTFLTKNMQVLVYGNWDHQSKNIKSFFTATYLKSEKEKIDKISFDSGIKFIFVGSLVFGKDPLYAIKLVEKLNSHGYKITLDLYGEGAERYSLENYIRTNKLGGYITLKGNQNKQTIKKVYQDSHFVILPSRSEGWPKAIAEGMFWGCVPLATKVSCVPFMIGYGERGLLLQMSLEKDIEQIQKIINNKTIFVAKSKKALEWSQEFTLDFFEEEIKKML